MAATKYLDYDGLLYFWTLLKAKLALKPDQDENVKQTVASDNKNYPILTRAIDGTTTGVGEAKFAASVTVNPSTGTISATKFSGAVEGKATTAAKLDPGANINGTLFTGESAITTSKWGTARNISISDSDGTNTGTAISVDGSAAKTLKLPATIKATLTGNASTATNVAWSGVTSKPSTISGYGINDAYTKTEIDNKLSSAVNYKGSVATYNDLPNSPTVGDMYNVTATDENYIWAGATGTEGQSGYVAAHWDPVGALVNLAAISNSEIDTVVAS